MIHWLITNVWPTALRSLVASLIGAGVANLVVGPLRREARRLRHQNAVIEDKLNTETPGGITDLLLVMRKVEDELDTKTPGGLTDVLHALQKIDSEENDDDGLDDGSDAPGRARVARIPLPRR